MFHIRLVAILAVALAGTACSPRYIHSTPIPVDLRAQPGTGLTRNVIVVSVDGLRPDAIGTYSAPTLQRLMK
jgi:hypothetical protein